METTALQPRQKLVGCKRKHAALVTRLLLDLGEALPAPLPPLLVVLHATTRACEALLSASTMEARGAHALKGTTQCTREVEEVVR